MPAHNDAVQVFDKQRCLAVNARFGPESAGAFPYSARSIFGQKKRALLTEEKRPL